LLLLPCTGLAQSDFTIDWFAVASGGGNSSGEEFALMSTIGQPIAGGTSGGDYALEGGFWSMVAVLQPGEPPLLRITLAVPNSVTLSWPAPAFGWVLQHSSTLDASSNWSDVGAPVVLIGEDNTVTQTVSAGVRFYRLYYP
jgi:hypothetical protein